MPTKVVVVGESDEMSPLQLLMKGDVAFVPVVVVVGKSW